MRMNLAFSLLALSWNGFINEEASGFSLSAPKFTSIRTKSCLNKNSNTLMSAIEEEITTTTSKVEPPQKKMEEVEVGGRMIQISKDGIYQLESAEDHAAIIAGNPDKIVLMKFYAPWCRACKGLAPKYIALANDPKLADLPLVFTEMSVVNNKQFIKGLGVLALPSVQFYVGCEGLTQNMPCGPSKVPILKKKLIKVINQKVDPDTRQLKPLECSMDAVHSDDEETKPSRIRTIKIGDYELDPEQSRFLRYEIPYFKDFTDEEYEYMISKATLRTYDSNSIIVKQGYIGNNFYVIESGEVEVSARSGFEDPIATPSTYLGAVFNTLGKNQFFGERSLITGEPRAGTIRTTEKTRCFVFPKVDIPSSSVLSGKKEASQQRLEQLDEKYGVGSDDYSAGFMDNQFTEASVASQARGSVNTPRPIAGVDNDISSSKVEDPLEIDRYHPPDKNREEIILPLLIRFKRIRQAARCFDYIARTKSSMNDLSKFTRRSKLVALLPRTTRTEFVEVWSVIDNNHDGKLSLNEMQSFMKGVGDEKSYYYLENILSKLKDPSNDEMTFTDFMGVMAEAEFYFLFTDMFNALDKFDSGFVRVADVAMVLSGMKDLVSETEQAMEIIDFKDMDMQIDYEQFSKMLLGATL